MAEKQYSIFLSCGTPDTQAQEDFRKAVKNHLKSCNCDPHTVGENVFTSRQPIQAARDLIGSCDGVVVIAFERTRIVKGLDKPATALPGKISNEAHPTVWNHMEAAMAYAQNVPILTLVQRGLKRQGMLSDRLEWKAIEGELNLALLGTEEFRQVFDDWMRYVKQGRPAPVLTAPESLTLDPGQMTIAQLLQAMKPGQLWSIAAALTSLLAIVASAAFWLGSHLGSGSVN
jgi:hypothetical protein